MEWKVFSPVIRSPPMTRGYSRPNSLRTFCNAASIADLLFGLTKSTRGSVLNSLSMGTPSGWRESLQFPALVADLHGVADAIIGASVWGDHAVTIDYRAGLLTFQREGIHPDLMTIYQYSDQPTISISVDGKSIPAILDTTLPDS